MKSARESLKREKERNLTARHRIRLSTDELREKLIANLSALGSFFVFFDTEHTGRVTKKSVGCLSRAQAQVNFPQHPFERLRTSTHNLLVVPAHVRLLSLSVAVYIPGSGDWPTNKGVLDPI